jgi:hypothetical protein
MDKRLFTLLTFAMVGFVLIAVGTLTAEDMPEEILIATKGYKRKVYKPVRFTHLTHVEDYGIECIECHHDYKDGENVWQEGDPVKECVDCHNPNRRQGKLPRLVFAFHFNCRKCHKENESGPIECQECHTKKEKSNAG